MPHSFPSIRRSNNFPSQLFSFVVRNVDQNLLKNLFPEQFQNCNKMAHSKISRSGSCFQQQIYSVSIHSVAQVIVRGVKMTITLKEFEVQTSDGAVETFILSIPSIEGSFIGHPKPNQKRAGSKSKNSLRPSRAQQEQTFSCYNCSKKFTSRSMLKRHVAIHNGIFRCPESGCESRYRNQTTLTKHQIAEHGLKLSRPQERGKRFAEGTWAENISSPSQSPPDSSTMSPDNHSNESSTVGSIRSLRICTADEDSAGSMMEIIPSSSASSDETKPPTIAEMKQNFTLDNYDIINSMDDNQFLEDNALLGKLFQTDDLKDDLENFEILA